MAESHVDVKNISLFDKYISELSFDKDLKRHIIQNFLLRKERLRQVTKQISVDQNFTCQLKDILNNVNDDTILFIGSRRVGTYLCGTLHNENEFLEFVGLFQDGCYNRFCHIVLFDKERGKSISHYIFIDEHMHKLIIKGVNNKCYNKTIDYFKF